MLSCSQSSCNNAAARQPVRDRLSTARLHEHPWLLRHTEECRCAHGAGAEMYTFAARLLFQICCNEEWSQIPPKKRICQEVSPALITPSPSNPLHGDMRLQRFVRTKQELRASTASLASLKALMHFIPIQAKWSHNPSATLTD